MWTERTAWLAPRTMALQVSIPLPWQFQTFLWLSAPCALSLRPSLPLFSPCHHHLFRVNYLSIEHIWSLFSCTALLLLNLIIEINCQCCCRCCSSSAAINGTPTYQLRDQTKKTIVFGWLSMRSLSFSMSLCGQWHSVHQHWSVIDFHYSN